MFKLLRYFSITSLISIAVASVVLGVFYRQLAIHNLIERGEEHNTDITQAFYNALWPQLHGLVAASNSLSPEQLRHHPALPALHESVRTMARGLSVVKVKVYNPAGVTVYSSEVRQIGEDASWNLGFKRAAAGKAASELVYRDQFSAFEQMIERTNLISTYIPVRGPGSERIEAVFELYDDVTPFIEKINNTQWTVVAGLLAVFGVLYGVLFVVVRRADGILRRQEQDLRRNLDELRESEAQLARTQYAVDHAAEMVFWIDDRGHFTYANRTSCDRLGYEHRELLALKLWDVDPGQPEASWGATWERIKREKQVRLETTHRTRSGETYPVEVTINCVSYGGREFACAFARDISERKRSEAALIAARDAAEAGGRAKTEFLANMGHELRTPMNGILGMTELALMEPRLPAEAREQLETVRDSARGLLAAVNGVLDYAEIDAGRIALARAPFSLRELLEREMELARLRARERGLDLFHTVQPEVPDRLEGDAARLRQVLYNLVGNAIKFTERGHVAVGVSAEAAEAGAVRLHFTVRDTGIGIAPEKQALIFEAFAQADGSARRRYGGTGLGLTVCARLAALMDGRLWVESEPGRGSTFHFSARFPVCEGSE